MSLRYFKKEMFQNPVYLKSGRTLQFAFTIDNTGVVEVDDEKESAFAEEMKKVSGKFGISEITEAQYADLKKKQPSPQRSERSKQLRIFEPNRDPFGARKQAIPIAVKSLDELPKNPPLAAPIATAPASAPPAAVQNPADLVVEAARLVVKPRTGNARAKKVK